MQSHMHSISCILECMKALFVFMHSISHCHTHRNRHASSNTHSRSHPPRTHFLTAPFPEHIFSQPPLADHSFPQNHSPNTSGTVSESCIMIRYCVTIASLISWWSLVYFMLRFHALSHAFDFMHYHIFSQPPLADHTFSRHRSPNTSGTVSDSCIMIRYWVIIAPLTSWWFLVYNRLLGHALSHAFNFMH